MDPKNILKVLKEASPFDLFLVSFLLLPFVFDAWLGIAEKLQWGVTAANWTLGLVLAAYVVGIIAMLVGSSRSKRRETARDQIIGYLTSKDFEMMSFERIRERINSTYSDDLLECLVTQFPNQLRKARLQGGKPGLARIKQTEVENEA